MRVTGIETLPVAVGGGYGYAVMPLAAFAA